MQICIHCSKAGVFPSRGFVGSKIKQVPHDRDCLSPLPRDQDSSLTSQYCDEIGHFSDLNHSILYVIKPVKKNHLWIGLVEFRSDLLPWRSEVMSQELEERVPMGMPGICS